MNIKTKSIVSGKIVLLQIFDKTGKLKARFENLSNLITQGLNANGGIDSPNNTHYAMTSTAENYTDLDGTWNQSGNTISRATGTGTFPSSPSQIDNELYWYDAGGNTGHRVHVTARASDTSITVSGVSKTITGGKLRRFHVNSAAMSTTGFSQSSSSVTLVSTNFDDVAGTRERIYQVNYASSASNYSLGSFIMSAFARVKLPATVDIEIGDQIEYNYTVTDTHTGRELDFEIASDSVGIPQKHSMLSIVGSGANVDVTFDAVTHFLAGDKLDLRGVTPKQFAIAGASSDSTTFYIETTAANPFSVSDSVVISGASVAGYNGTFTVSAVTDANNFEITNAANPGAMGASGQVRLATPATYFDDLGLATIASMQSGGTVARITSAITGPDVEPAEIGGDPGVNARFYRSGSAVTFEFPTFSNANCRIYQEADAKALVDVESPTNPATTGSLTTFDSHVSTAGAAVNDYTRSVVFTKNSGTGTSGVRIKQIDLRASSNVGTFAQITFNTPFDKSETERLRVTVSKQIRRTLDLTGLP